MSPRPLNLPEHFDLAAFQRVASMRSTDPEDFARLNRFGPIAGPHFYKKFTAGERNACLIQRNSPVLMVAHVDTVLHPKSELRVEGQRLYHNAIDNRLGVYLGLEVLPAMGLHVDLLLTTGEEKHFSSAALLDTRKQYRWTFSFDRKGEDLVCYQYECSAVLDIMQASGFSVSVGEGTYSCVAELEHLGCVGMNFGCGMADYHSDNAYCNLGMLDRQLRRFATFYAQNSNLLFPHRLPEGVKSRSNLHHWSVPFESLLWQFEYHRARGADKAADDCQKRLAFLLGAAPELRKEFQAELGKIPELATDRAEGRRRKST